ncbi:MAG: CpaF family protein, partial [Bacteriovoracales bacterium]
ANSPLESCTRLESLCLMGDIKIPPDVIRRMVGAALQVIVQCTRYPDGGRRLSHISEVLGVDRAGNYIVKDIFRWVQTGKTDDGKFIGEMRPCNYVPSFFDAIVTNQLPFPKTLLINPHDKEKTQAA